MNRAHLIDTATFDFNFSSEALAFELQSDLNTLIKSALMPVINEVFDSSVKTDSVLRVALLEIDLGTVTHDNYRYELPRRLNKQLSEWFSKVGHPDPISPALNNRQLDSETSTRDLVAYFLLHGFLPWHAHLSRGETVEQRLNELLTKRPQIFIQFLRATQYKKVVFNRLVAQFSVDTVFSVLQLLSPTHADRIKRRMAECLVTYVSGEFSSRDRLGSADVLRHRLWSALLFVLISKGPQAEIKQVFEQLLIDLEPLSPRYVKSLAIALNQSTATNCVESFGQIEEINPEQNPRFRQLQKRWGDAILSGQFTGVKSVWSDLLKTFPLLIERGLRHHGKLAEVRKRIAHGFPEPVLCEMLAILEPREHSFISSVIDNPELFQRQLITPPPKERVSKQLWEYTLAYLLVERGSHFNKISYLGSVLLQMAAANNLSYAKLLSGLIEKVAPLTGASNTARMLLQSLMALADVDEEVNNNLLALNRHEATARVNSDAKAQETHIQRQIAAAILQGDFLYVKTVWAKVLDSYAPQLESALRYYGKQAHIRKQLAYQFPEPALNAILVEIEPVEHGFISTVVAQPALFQQLSDKSSVPHQQLSRQMWEFTLTYLLVERGSHFNKKSYLGSVVRQMAAANNLSQTVFIVGLRAHVATLEKLNRNAQQLLQILSELDLAATAIEPPVNPQHDIAERLQLQLIGAILQGPFKHIKADWTVLLRDHRQVLQQTLKQYGQQADVRRRIVQTFPVSALKQILLVLEPTEQAFILSLVTEPSLFQRERGSPVMAAEKIGSQLWEFTLAYLLVERGTGFNKKSYLRSLIRQMAAANNFDHAELLAGLTQQVAALAASSRSANNMLRFLVELAQQEGGAVADNHEATLFVQQQEYALYDELISILKGQSADQGRHEVNHTQALLNGLARTAPWLFMRLLRELQFSRLAPAVTIETLSAPLLRLLVLIFTRLSQSPHRGDSEFMEAVASHATKAADAARFYSKILHCLLNNELIDLDEIMLDVNASAQSLNSAPTSKPESSSVRHIASDKDHKPQAAELPVPLIADDEVILLMYLMGDAGVTPHQERELLERFKRLLDRHPQQLRHCLAEVAIDPQQLVRLITLLPERLLCQSIAVMGGREQRRLLQSAELIATVCYVRQLKINVQHIDQIKWQAIFAYIAAYGGRFNEALFVSHLLKALFKRSRENNSELFKTEVLQRLEQGSVPSTRDVTKCIIKCVTQTDAQLESKITALAEVVSVAEVNITQVEKYEDEALMPEEDIYITNAGMVIVIPYIQRLFDMMGFTEKSQFKDQQAAVRAVHILQYMVDESTDSPEYQLVLNKLLCGVKVGTPIERKIEITEQEKQQTDGLLQGIIQNWKALGSTSISGLRESFFQREGRLQLKEGAWHLLVEPRAFDMLLDQCPWSFSTIKFPWMERVIYVEWR